MAKRVKDCLSREPQRINDEFWYYEEKKGLCMVHEIRVKPEEIGIYDNNFIRTDQIVIPWRKIKKSIERYYQGQSPAPQVPTKELAKEAG